MRFDPIKPKHETDNSSNWLFFIMACAALLFLFDSYVMQPKLAQLKKVQEVQQAKQLEAAPKIAKPLPVAEVVSKTERLDILNEKVKGSINLKGGRIDNLTLSEYFKTLDKNEPVDLLNPTGTEFPFYAEFGWVSDDTSVTVPGKNTQWSIKADSRGAEPVLSPGNPVTLVWDNGQGVSFERVLSLDENFLITVDQKITNRTDRELVFHPYALISRHGVPADLIGTWILHEGPIAYFNKELHQQTYKDLVKGKDPFKKASSDGWIGITDKYWMVSLLPDQFKKKTYRFKHTSPDIPDDKPRFQVDMLGDGHIVPAGGVGTYTNHLFAGAKQVELIEEYEEQLNVPHFDLAVDFGWFYFFTKPIFHTLHYFFTWTGNFGLAIIMLTFCLRLLVFPLANTSYKSFARLKQVSPEIMELRERYGDDKQALQKEIVKLYEREKVNPLSGCLPILVQIPIFFSLYKVLYITIEMRHAPFYGWIQDLSERDPTSILNLFGLLPYDVPGFIPDILNIGIWPFLMLGTLLIQQRLNPPPQDPMQRQMMLFFPFIICFVMSQFAAGLVLYWTMSAFLGIIQQYIIMRRMGVEVHLFKRSKAEEKMDDMVAEGPDIHPEAEMVTEDIEDAMFGHEEGDDTPSKPISKPKPKKSKKR